MFAGEVPPFVFEGHAIPPRQKLGETLIDVDFFVGDTQQSNFRPSLLVVLAELVREKTIQHSARQFRHVFLDCCFNLTALVNSPLHQFDAFVRRKQRSTQDSSVSTVDQFLFPLARALFPAR